MGQFIGNQRTCNHLLSDFGRYPVSVISGPSYTGKMTWISGLIQSHTHDSDIYISDSSVASAREAIEFASSRPSFSSYRVIIIDNAQSLSEPAQDAYLKLCEEPPNFLRFYFVTEDHDIFLPSLRSRLSYIYRWSRLDDSEMKDFIQVDSLSPDEEAGRLCFGCPGLYHVISSTPGLKSFYSEIMKSFDLNYDSVLAPIPEVLSELKDDVKRAAAIRICVRAFYDALASSVDRFRLSSLLNFSSVLHRHPSANAEIYWSKYSLM